MTILNAEAASQVAQIGAARDSEIAARNASRLENWQRRLFRDPVETPVPVDPPEWPAIRSSIAAPKSNVTKLRVRK